MRIAGFERKSGGQVPIISLRRRPPPLIQGGKEVNQTMEGFLMNILKAVFQALFQQKKSAAGAGWIFIDRAFWSSWPLWVILAAIGIPVYTDYQNSAKRSSVGRTIDQIQSTWSACLTLNNFATCNTQAINNTFKQMPGGMVIHTSGTDKGCFLIEIDNYQGCVDFENDGTGVAKATPIYGFPVGTNCADIMAGGVTCTGGAAI